MLENLLIDSPIFSSGSAGCGVAIKNPDGKIFAPFAGTVKFFASPGVIGLKSFGGVELLIHVGLKTCKLIGESFKPQVAAGDIITHGQILLTFDPQEISRAGFDAVTPVVVTNPENFGDIIFQLGNKKIIAHFADFCINKEFD